MRRNHLNSTGIKIGFKLLREIILHQRLIVNILTGLVTVILSACSITNSYVTIKDIRVEDSQINALFSNNSNVENFYAQWNNNHVELISRDNSQQKILASFSLEDDYEFKSTSSATKSLWARIIYGGDNSLINWDDLDRFDDSASDNFIFVISPDEPDKMYEDMVYVPGGYIMMGSKYQDDELPVHKIYVDGFYMDKYEVTVAEYQNFCRATRRVMPKQPYWNDDNHPVVKVSWNDATAFAKWKKKRLPTEAEWEYAARSGSKGYFYSWGNTNPSRKKGGNVADEALRSEKKFWRIWKNYYDGFVYTAPRGAFYSNYFGLYDMTGNVWEWCSDWYDAGYYPKSAENNPKGPTKGSHKVLRGGSWNYSPRDVLTTRRMHYRSDVTLDYIGFRCVRDQ